MATLMLANPGRKLKRAKRKTRARRSLSAAPRKATKRRYRRNPIAMGSMGVGSVIKSGAIGAIGAFGVDLVMSKIPQLQTLGGAQMAPVVKGAVGFAIGMAVAKLGKNRALGVSLAEGALTVQLHSLLKGTVGKSMGLAGDYDDFDLDTLNAYGLDFDDTDMSVSGGGDLLGSDLLGYTNAAPVMMGMGAYTDSQ
jgi:hypothetical protein